MTLHRDWFKPTKEWMVVWIDPNDPFIYDPISTYDPTQWKILCINFLEITGFDPTDCSYDFEDATKVVNLAKKNVPHLEFAVIHSQTGELIPLSLLA